MLPMPSIRSSWSGSGVLSNRPMYCLRTTDRCVASDAVQAVVVVMQHDTSLKAPLTVDLVQLALVETGCKQPAFAFFCEEYGEIACRVSFRAIHRHPQVRNDVP